MDRGLPIGNSPDAFSRRAAHVKVGNKSTEPIPVFLTNAVTGQTRVDVYSETLALAAGTETTIASYTVPPASFFELDFAAYSGSNVAIFRLKINGVTVDTGRIWHGFFDGSFDFGGSPTPLILNAGDVITVTALHNRPNVGDFNARIQGSLST